MYILTAGKFPPTARNSLIRAAFFQIPAVIGRFASGKACAPLSAETECESRCWPVVFSRRSRTSPPTSSVMRWEGYSYVDQTVSELAALERRRGRWSCRCLDLQPSAPCVPAGVAQSGARGMRAAAAMLAAIGLLGAVAFFFPIHMRGSAWTINETMHSVLTGLTVIALLLAIGFAGAAAGPRFRIYSFITIAIALAAGMFAGWIGRGLATDQPTPWIGIIERVSIYRTDLGRGAGDGPDAARTT